MTTLSMKSPILEQSGGSSGSSGSTGNGVSRVRADPPPTRAGGQDDGSLPNSLKLICLRASRHRAPIACPGFRREVELLQSDFMAKMRTDSKQKLAHHRPKIDPQEVQK